MAVPQALSAIQENTNSFTDIMGATITSPMTQPSPQELARSLVSDTLDEYSLPPGRSRLKAEIHLESQIAHFFKQKQTQGNHMTENLKHSAKVLIVNSLVMRRLGRFKDKQVAAEGEQWVKSEWEKMDKPEPQPEKDQEQSAKVDPCGLKKDQDDVDRKEDGVYGERVEHSYATLSVGSLVDGDGSKKVVIDLTLDEDEESSEKEAQALYPEPEVFPASLANNDNMEAAVVEYLQVLTGGLKRTFDDKAMELPRGTKRQKLEGYEEE